MTTESEVEEYVPTSKKPEPDAYYSLGAEARHNIHIGYINKILELGQKHTYAVRQWYAKKYDTSTFHWAELWFAWESNGEKGLAKHKVRRLSKIEREMHESRDNWDGPGDDRAGQRTRIGQTIKLRLDMGESLKGII